VEAVPPLRVGASRGMADEEDELPVPKRKVLIQNVSGYIGRNLSKRFTAADFEVLGTLKSEGDVKPLSVSRIVSPSPEALTAAFLESELTVLDCLGDMEAAEGLLSTIANVAPLESSKVVVGISSVMTWSRTSPDKDEPDKPITEADYKKRRPHSSYKGLLDLEKLVTKSKREGLRTHVVCATLVWALCSAYAHCHCSWHLASPPHAAQRLKTLLLMLPTGCCWAHVWRGGGLVSPALQSCME
jgi:hypothetical protein